MEVAVHPHQTVCPAYACAEVAVSETIPPAARMRRFDFEVAIVGQLITTSQYQPTIVNSQCFRIMTTDHFAEALLESVVKRKKMICPKMPRGSERNRWEFDARHRNSLKRGHTSRFGLAIIASAVMLACGKRKLGHDRQ